jgi:hypothetical protein
VPDTNEATSVVDDASKLDPRVEDGPGKENVQKWQEGNGRSDAVRLLMRGTLRRV